MTLWLLKFVSLTLLAAGGGRLTGKRFGHQSKPNPIKIAAASFLVVVLWFVFSWEARRYADTDRLGWQLAESWAHTGKSYALLVGILFGLTFATTVQTEKWPRAGTALCILLLVVIAWRTMPVYVFLGQGSRDSDGFLRQSRQLQCTCGSVALANYLEQFRKAGPISEKEITRACATTSEGSTVSDLLRAARSYGVTNAVVRCLTFDELSKASKPAIVSISTVSGMLHATLLVGMNDELAIFIDPAYGKWASTTASFKKSVHRKTILFE